MVLLEILFVGSDQPTDRPFAPHSTRCLRNKSDRNKWYFLTFKRTPCSTPVGETVRFSHETETSRKFYNGQKSKMRESSRRISCFITSCAKHFTFISAIMLESKRKHISTKVIKIVIILPVILLIFYPTTILFKATIFEKKSKHKPRKLRRS